MLSSDQWAMAWTHTAVCLESVSCCIAGTESRNLMEESLPRDFQVTLPLTFADSCCSFYDVLKFMVKMWEQVICRGTCLSVPFKINGFVCFASPGEFESEVSGLSLELTSVHTHLEWLCETPFRCWVITKGWHASLFISFVCLTVILCVAHGCIRVRMYVFMCVWQPRYALPPLINLV